MSKPILLSSYLSSCGWRVRIVLEVKKVDFEYHPVYLWPDTGEQQSEKFKTMNPMGQVPVLLVDGKPISQSVAIMEYLEEMYPEPRMLPTDAYLRAKCREVVELLVSGVQPIQSIGLIPILGKVEWKKWAECNITRGFTGKRDNRQLDCHNSDERPHVLENMHSRRYSRFFYPNILIYRTVKLCTEQQSC
nr:maleylacetoacetate isomerase-like [Rhipicephalus microplus]